MTIEMIAAIGRNGEIGKDNKLLWKLNSDMKMFRKRTLFQNVVMGSNTYKSIGKPLERRNNIILTRDEFYRPHEDVKVFHSIDDVIGHYKYESLMVIGGQTIYQQFLHHADRLYLTIVEAEFPEADAFFPKLSDEWKCVSKYQRLKDKDNEYDHWYCIYEKVKV